MKKEQNSSSLEFFPTRSQIDNHLEILESIY